MCVRARARARVCVRARQCKYCDNFTPQPPALVRVLDALEVLGVTCANVMKSSPPQPLPTILLSLTGSQVADGRAKLNDSRWHLLEVTWGLGIEFWSWKIGV